MQDKLSGAVRPLPEWAKRALQEGGLGYTSHVGKTLHFQVDGKVRHFYVIAVSHTITPEETTSEFLVRPLEEGQAGFYAEKDIILLPPHETPTEDE